ncbi:MAG: nitrous oxide reductase accessory protein NosL [Deltaproteobacteria bacterium]|nr:nitrous oxide reductase accessory protein NosL [Deltaproteobacteria bacterium]
MKKWEIVFAISLLVWASVAVGGKVVPVKPGPKDKCPVCGMFSAQYTNWVTQIVFKDGTYAVFDGAKDMFRYYFDIPRYAKGKTKKDVANIFVTDYYTTKWIPAADALFVLGSDVYGPMGEELVPVKGKKEAEEFLKDHNAKKILTFDMVTPGDIPLMKKMRKHGR